MNYEFLILGGYGLFVWPAFLFTLISCLVLYLKVKRDFQKQEEIFLKEFKKIQTKEIIKTKKRLNEIYAKHTGKDITNVELIMERDKYFSPAEAIEFGLIDKIVEDRK